MAQDNQRIYVGSGKKVGQYDLINISICMDDLPTSALFEAKNGKKYVNLTVGSKKGGADQYGKTHSVWINDFKPEKKENRAEENRQPSRPSDTEIEYPEEEVNAEDIPF